MKKLLAVLLCVMMVVAFMPTMAFAAETGAEGADSAIEVETVQELSDALETGGEIKLTADIDLRGASLSLPSRFWEVKTVLDLGGHTLSGDGFVLIVNGYNNLEVKNGTIKKNNANNGSSTIWMYRNAKLTVNKGATIESAGKNAFAVVFDQNCKNASLTVYGNLVGITGGSGFTINGYVESDNTVTIAGDAVINADGIGLYLAGNGKTTVTDNASITGGTGIEIRAGELNVSGNVKITGTATPTAPVKNPSGSTTVGAGIAVAQHTTKQPITVKVEEGTITGSPAFYQHNVEENQPEDVEKVSVEILGGDYVATNGGKAVQSENKTGFVKGGTFSTDFITDEEKAYLPAGTETKQQADGEYVLAPAENAVAQIGNAGFTTLQAAIDAANNGDTVVLKKDTTENVEIKDGQNIVLDLNGNTLSGGTVSGKAALKNNGTVTIQDSSSDNPEGEIRREDNGTSGYYVIDNQGTMTIESGNFYNMTGPMPRGSSLIRNAGLEKEATLNINGGSILHDGFIAVKNDDRGILNVTGGTIKTTGDTDTHTASAIQNWNKADITGGTIEGTIWTSTWSNTFPDSVTTISGDTQVKGKIIVKQEGTGITTTPTLNISGGTFDEIWSVQEGEGVKVNVTGGTFKSEDVAKYVDQKNVYEQKDTYYVGNPPANTSGNNTWVEVKDENGNGTGIFVEQYVSSGYYPITQNPTIETSEGVTVTKGSTGTTATITVADGYELVDVTVNGVSQGKVTTLTGLKTGDKVVVTAQKVAEDDTAAQIAEVKSVKLVARSAMSKAKGKKAVKITWYATDGSDVKLDGVEIFRSTERYSGYGTKPFFSTTKDQYHNTAIKVGTKYYYKVRGYKVIDGEKVYTEYSTKAWRTVK